MYEAFQTFQLSHDEQVHASADLLDKEIWAITGILGASGWLWGQLPTPTLSFALDSPSAAEAPHLELGTYAHLAALEAPSCAERALATATAPCFARVSAHPDRSPTGATGALAYSYVPVSLSEAVATLGCKRIVTEIEAATRRVGEALLGEAETQRERQAYLRGIERKLGWDPVTDVLTVPTSVKAHLALFSGVQSEDCWLAFGAASAGAAAFVCGLLLLNPLPILAFIAVATWFVRWKSTPTVHTYRVARHE